MPITGTTAGTVIAAISTGVAQNKVSGVPNNAAEGSAQVEFDNEAPNAPTSVFLDLLVANTQRLHATWSASTSSDVQCYEYRIERQWQQQGWIAWRDWNPTVLPQITLSNVGFDAVYQYRIVVRAKDEAGNYSSETISNVQSAGGGNVLYLYFVSKRGIYYISQQYKDIDNYLADIRNKYIGDVNYQKQQDLLPKDMPWADGATQAVIHDVLSKYNTVVIFCPYSDLTQVEQNALVSFICGESGTPVFQKRLVLVGEWGAWTQYTNDRLNNLASQMGIKGRFTTTDVRDDSPDESPTYARHCQVNSNSYLMTGVSYLWDAQTSPIWDSSFPNPPGTPLSNYWLAHLDSPSYMPWITEETTPAGGSVVMIHDSNLFMCSYGPNQSYNPYHYTDALSANAPFVRNLCAVFNQ